MYKGMDSDASPTWWQRIVWPNLCYNVVILALLITTVVLSANTLGQVDQVTTCRLRYEGGANDLTEREFQNFAAQQGWFLTHPQSPDCNRCKDPGRFPVWMAPVDICLRFELSSSHPLCSGETENLQRSHVKVCATQQQIDRAWADTGCHTTDGNVTKPILGYDGNLFCEAPAPAPCEKVYDMGSCWDYDYRPLNTCELCHCTSYDKETDKECTYESFFSNTDSKTIECNDLNSEDGKGTLIQLTGPPIGFQCNPKN